MPIVIIYNIRFLNFCTIHIIINNKNIPCSRNTAYLPTLYIMKLAKRCFLGSRSFNVSNAFFVIKIIYWILTQLKRYVGFLCHFSFSNRKRHSSSLVLGHRLITMRHARSSYSIRRRYGLYRYLSRFTRFD